MLININTLKERIHGVILNKGEQGHKIEGLENPTQRKIQDGELISGAADAADAGAKAGLASRTNTLLSLPMLYLMVYSAHSPVKAQLLLKTEDLTGLWVGIAIILLIEANALFGKMNPMIASVKAVIHSGLVLAIIFALLVHYL